MMKQLPQRRRMRPHSILVRRGLLAVAAVVAPILACEPDASPARLTAPLVASRSAATTEDLVSPGWQAIEANLVAQANLAAVVSTRAYSLLGVAQYLAVQRAEGSRRDGRSRDGSDAGAVAGASATVLSYLFPLRAQALQDTVKAQRGAGPGFARGEVIGRAVGTEIVARAQADGFSTPFTGAIPVGPGLWVSNTTPPTIAGGPLPGVRPWFLKSARQLRPGPPPAFGSADFLAALAEIRHISDTRTAEQTENAGPSAGVRIRGLPGGTGGDPSHLRHPHRRADRDRDALGAGRGYTHDCGLLASGRDGRHRIAQTVGAAGDAPLRVAQRLDVRRADRVLGREGDVLAHPAVAGGPRDHGRGRGRKAQPSILSVRTQLYLLVGRRGAELVLPR